MSTVKILLILEAASIEPRQARAIAECLELVVKECRIAALAHDPAPSPSLTMREVTQDLRVYIVEAKNEIIRWMSILWIAQIFATAALIKLLQ